MQLVTPFHQAELDAAKAMRSWGFVDAVATTGGADGGLDVRSMRALAQVKWRIGKTGRPEVQQLYGARAAGQHKLFFFSKSGYTDQAIVYADSVAVALFVIDAGGGVTPVNRHARPYVTKWWALPFSEIARIDILILGLVALGFALCMALWWLIVLTHH